MCILPWRDGSQRARAIKGITAAGWIDASAAAIPDATRINPTAKLIADLCRSANGARLVPWAIAVSVKLGSLIDCGPAGSLWSPVALRPRLATS